MSSRGMRLRAQASSLAVAIMLAACGGGGGGGGGGGTTTTPTPTQPTPVPETLALTVPSGAEAAVELQFGNSASSLAGLSFSWDFGDGKTSTEASPKHAFAKGGDYEVVLKVSNAAGASREQRAKLSITNLANVKGLVCSGANDGGWCWQQPLPTGNSRYSTYFLNATTVFTVGDNGEIFRSGDAGATWTAQRSGVTTALRSVSFTTAQDGWIVGDYGALLRTSDGGTTWNLSKLPDSNYSSSTVLTTIDANKAILGDSRYTLDGGKTWTTPPYTPSYVSSKGVFWRLDYSGNLGRSTDFGLSTPTVLEAREDGFSLEYRDLSLVDDKNLVLSASFSRYDYSTYRWIYKPVMWRSTDGGTTWTRTEPTGLSSYGYSSVVHVLRVEGSTLVGYSGEGMLRSVDGGKSWTSAAVSDGTGYYYSPNYNQSLVAGKTMLVPGYQAMFRSVDDGLTWTRSTITGAELSYDYFSGLRQIEGDNFSMRDGQGRTFLSTDAGRTWKLASSSANNSTYGAASQLAFLDGKRGLMLSAKGELNETKDGGKTWAVKLPGIATGGDFQLQFVNDKTGWMLLGDGRLYKTTDGASTWGSPMLVRNSGLSAIGFSDENRGWGRTRYGSPGYVVTADGGKSWSDITPPSYTQGLYLISDQQLIAYGSYGLLATSADGGKTWTQRFTGSTGAVIRVTGSGGKTLWASGGYGMLMRSEDMGATWTTIDLGVQQETFSDVAFADARNGWVVGTRGLVFATTDGGKSWSRQATGTARDLRRVMPVDAKTAWITGDAGILLATGNGGF